jgi:hypothetical protein
MHGDLHLICKHLLMFACISHASVGVYNFLLCVQMAIEKVAVLRLSLADM